MGRNSFARAESIRRSLKLPPLARFILRRAAALVVLCLGITVVTFTLTLVVPGDPAAANLDDRALADPRVVAAFRARYGLDQPAIQQYAHYLSNILHGDLGESMQSRRPVMVDLRDYVPATLELTVSSMLIGLLLGGTLGITAALQRNRAFDHVVRVASLGGISVPTFWLALIAIYVVYVQLSLVPGTGRLSPGAPPPPRLSGLFTIDALVAGDLSTLGDALHHLVLPAGVLAVYNAGLLTRFIRSAVLEVLHHEYVLAARAKGLNEWVIVLRHVVRAAMPPIITVFGLALANVLTGAVLVEQIFGWPGVGQYAFRSATTLDLPSIMGVSLFVTIIYVAINFMVDLAYAVIDPRIRLA